MGVVVRLRFRDGLEVSLRSLREPWFQTYSMPTVVSWTTSLARFRGDISIVGCERGGEGMQEAFMSTHVYMQCSAVQETTLALNVLPMTSSLLDTPRKKSDFENGPIGTIIS